VFNSSIVLIFQSGFQALICFSRVMAASID
jgi:hypothetical protein